MSIGCSSSRCNAPFHRYTERQGARMLTQAASRFSTRLSASRSAAARSGRLVNTNSVLMRQSFIYGRVAQLQAENPLQAPVVQSPRFVHERKQLRGYARLRLAACDAQRPWQPGARRDEVEPLAHLETAIVRGVVGARGCVVLERAHAAAR